MRRKRVLLIMTGVSILAGVLLMTLLRPRPQVLYKVTFLPALGGVETRAYGINDRGQVVAMVRTAREGIRVFLWDRSEDTRTVASFADGCDMVSLHLNDRAQVAGTVREPNGTYRAFFWDPNEGVQRLGTLGGLHTTVHGLNDLGQVVGMSRTAATVSRAFRWDKAGGMADLGTLGGKGGRACAINRHGQIVGFAHAPDERWYAFLADPNGAMSALGIAPRHDWATCNINDVGDVVGDFGSPQETGNVSVWSRRTGARRVLSTRVRWTQTCALNDKGEFLVNISQSGFRLLGRWVREGRDAYLYDRAGGCRRLSRCLDQSNVQALTATGMNNDGVICGSLMVKRLGQPHAVILEPIK